MIAYYYWFSLAQSCIVAMALFLSHNRHQFFFIFFLDFLVRAPFSYYISEIHNIACKWIPQILKYILHHIVEKSHISDFPIPSSCPVHLPLSLGTFHLTFTVGDMRTLIINMMMAHLYIYFMSLCVDLYNTCTIFVCDCVIEN